MSEYTTIYAHRKGTKPIFHKWDQDAQTDKDYEPYGIELVELSTTPSRDLGSNVHIPCTYDCDGPQVFTEEMLYEAIAFYEDKLSAFEKGDEEIHSRIKELEERIKNVSDVNVYNKIDEQITELKESLDERKEEFDEFGYGYFLARFKYIKEILNSNAEYYELIYTKG